MNYLQDKEYCLESKVNVACKYLISSKHRYPGNPNKSWWLISPEDEVNCFIHSFKSMWKKENLHWGLYFRDSSIDPLGRNTFHEELKIAKFIDSSNNKLWHGYPADYVRKSQDRPSMEILRKWLKQGIISKSVMSKIRRGQICNL